ncbi:MAG: hypothetical protein DRI70_08350 [Bacteroidetes bacterium]|nr:MAG: hypothetical protein DRI70_08350 [Bacteroidota bacterium]
MKVYSISKWAFYGISLLIFSLPVSRHWKLFTDGQKAEGKVIAYNRVLHENLTGEVTLEYASEIHFSVEDSICKAYGPFNYEFKSGRIVKVLYDPRDPSNHSILTFSGFYLNNYSIIPLLLMVLWTAFYLSFNTYSKRKKKQK